MDIIDHKMSPLWLNSLKNEERLIRLFSTVGKLLYVCQRFEINCKRIAAHIRIFTTDDLFASEVSYTNFLNQIKISSLNSNIKVIEKLKVVGNPIEIFSQARISRNFIAHEICVGLENKILTVSDHSKFESEILRHGTVIANAEFVSSYLCGSLLKDPLPNLNRVSDTLSWLFNT